MPRDPAAVYHPWGPGDGDKPFSMYLEIGWALRVMCWDCEREVQIAPAELVERFGGPRTIADVHPRMVCQCGSKKVVLYIVNNSLRPGQFHSESRG